ncbi:hypothetical protein CW304_16975 [Bacillus sp. UFRGS-B20]|nr:hypothetical protein CW304_16975 [Bacillus sp. UFRGS-B20]
MIRYMPLSAHRACSSVEVIIPAYLSFNASNLIVSCIPYRIVVCFHVISLASTVPSDYSMPMQIVPL